MELFNSNLFDKYDNLKKRKALVEEEWNHKRDSQIREYQSDVECSIEELKNENDRLRKQVVSIQQQYAECEENLHQECQKTKQLSNEVERLQNLVSHNNDKCGGTAQTSPSASPRVRSRSKAKASPGELAPNSCSRETEAQNKEAAIDPHSDGQKEQLLLCEESPNTDRLIDRASSCKLQTDCIRRNLNSEEKTGKNQSSCLFQILLEVLVGMKFGIGDETEEPCLSVTHQMSGYTFTLTWLRHEGEGQLMYHVSSLGTLERVALEWMKEDMVFSMTMCPVFFERILRVMGLRCL